MKRFIIAAAICILLPAVAAFAAWKNDEPLTFGDKPLLGDSNNVRLAWNTVSKRVGLAYIEKGTTAVIYIEWQPGTGVVLKENVGATGTTCLGLAYDAKGMPRVGILGLPDFMEYVKQPDGSWVGSDTGVKATAGGYYRGSYALNPVSGTGAFLVCAGVGLPRTEETYIYSKDGKWLTEKCGNGGIGGSSLVFTDKGVPFATWCDDIPPDPVETVGMKRYAGIATPGATNFQEISTGVVYMYLPQNKIAIDPVNGEIRVGYINSDWFIYERKWSDTGWTAPEMIDMKSSMNGGQLGFAISPAHDRVAMFPTTDMISGAGSTGGITMAYWDHEKAMWKSETMPFLGYNTGLDLIYDPEGNLYGTYTGITSDQFHLLSGYEPPAPLYVKVKMNDQPEPCIIHVYGLNYNGAGLTNCNIWKDGMKVDEQYTNYPQEIERYMSGNDESPWVDLTQMNLSPAGDNKLQFFAMQTYPGYSGFGLASSNFTLTFSNKPSDDGIIKSFTRSGTGSGMMVSVDLLKRDKMMDDLASSKWQNDIAKALPPLSGKRPVKFPISEAGAIHSKFFQPETVNTEIDTMSRLGFNGFVYGYAYNFDPVWYKAGFTHVGSGTNYRFAPYIVDNERANPNREEIAKYVKSDLKSFTDLGLLKDISQWSLYDEPSANSMDYIVNSPVCQAKFREYLQKIGLTPQYFGETAWDKVFPTADKAKAKLYYHTAMYRSSQLVDLFKAGTDPLKEVMPNVPTTANFSDEVETSGSMMASGVDQFAIFEQEGLRLGWTENWMPWTATLQLNGYLCDTLRAAVDEHGTGKFGIYNCRGWGSKLNWDIAGKAISSVGHGAQEIFHYNWGPYYAIAVDVGSHRPAWYPALQTADNAIGAVEDYLVGAKVPKSKVAILYSQATDIWTLDESGPAFGQDYCGLWLILRHLGYPVDIVQEKDVAAGKLTKDNYKMVICNSRHLLDTAMPALVSWLKAGGVLYMGPGALTYDQYNVPLEFDKLAGISRADFVYSTPPGVAIYFPKLTDLMPVTYGTDKLEALSGYQKMNRTPPKAKVLATFADGSPAVFTLPVGKGLLEYSGFFPGLSYEKAAVITRTERDRTDPDFPSQSSNDWPVAYRTLFAELLKPVGFQLPVTTSHYLVEADRLEGPATYPGSVIAITNWTGKPLTNLTITLPRNGMMGVPETVINPIISQSTTDGVLTLTMDINGPVDFLVVPRR